jgi:hypothetical protein
MERLMWCDVVYASAGELFFVAAGDNALQPRHVNNANWRAKHDRLDSFDYNKTAPSGSHNDGCRHDFH